MRNSAIYDSREKQAENEVRAGGKYFNMLEKRTLEQHYREKVSRQGAKTRRKRFFGDCDGTFIFSKTIFDILLCVLASLRENFYEAR
jgi:hypothetical protein